MDEVKCLGETQERRQLRFIEAQKKGLPLQPHQPTKCELHCYVISAIYEVNDE